MIASFGSRLDSVFVGIKRNQRGKLVVKDCRNTDATISEGRHCTSIGGSALHNMLSDETE